MCRFPTNLTRKKGANDEENSTVKKLLVAGDGSSPSRKAAEFAIGPAVQTRAGIVLLNVIDTTSLVPRPIPESSTPLHIIETMEDYLREAAAAFMEEIIALCRKGQVAAEQVIKKIGIF